MIVYYVLVELFAVPTFGIRRDPEQPPFRDHTILGIVVKDIGSV